MSMGVSDDDDGAPALLLPFADKRLLGEFIANLLGQR
jgi:hypothetical protein